MDGQDGQDKSLPGLTGLERRFSRIKNQEQDQNRTRINRIGKAIQQDYKQKTESKPARINRIRSQEQDQDLVMFSRRKTNGNEHAVGGISTPIRLQQNEESECTKFALNHYRKTDSLISPTRRIQVLQPDSFLQNAIHQVQVRTFTPNRQAGTSTSFGTGNSRRVPYMPTGRTGRSRWAPYPGAARRVEGSLQWR